MAKRKNSKGYDGFSFDETNPKALNLRHVDPSIRASAAPTANGQWYWWLQIGAQRVEDFSTTRDGAKANIVFLLKNVSAFGSLQDVYNWYFGQYKKSE